jgi:hypothetical protein
MSQQPMPSTPDTSAQAGLDPTLATARAKERERCAQSLQMSNDELRLMAGEMTAQELRTAQAILKACAARIRRFSD